MIVVYLTTSTFEGFSPGASHWYGTLRWDALPNGRSTPTSHEVERPVTASMARQWNREEGHSLWSKGDTTNRFDDKADVVRRAGEIFQRDFGPGNVLIKGSHCCCDPQLVLIGPEVLKEKANALWVQWQKCDGWDGETPVAEVLAVAWDKLWGKRLGEVE